MKVNFVELAKSHAEVGDALHQRVREIIDGSGFIGGEAVSSFEHLWREYCGANHAVGVGNGTDALALGFRALGIGRGDEIIVPANTFVATAEAVVLAGATPVFVDVDEASLLLDPGAVEAAVTRNTAAVVAVHLYGQMCDMDALGALCGRHGIALVEDACQAHGARWGEHGSGSFGAFAAFSFYPGKNLGAFGDGGAIVTGDGDLAARARALGNHGREHPNPSRASVSTNSRLDALQAAVLEVKFGHLERWNDRRRAAADSYVNLLSAVPGVRVTEQRRESQSAYHLFVIRTEERDAVRLELSRLGVETGIHYDTPCHRHPMFAGEAVSPLPIAEDAAATVLSLPMHPHLDASEVQYVVDSVERCVAQVAMTAKR